MLWSFTYPNLKWIESIKQTRIHIIQSLSDSLCAALTIETYSDLIVSLIRFFFEIMIQKIWLITAMFTIFVVLIGKM